MRTLTALAEHPFRLPITLLVLSLCWFAYAPVLAPELPNFPIWQSIATVLFMVGVGIWAMQIGGRALWALPLSFSVLLLCGLATQHTTVAMIFAEEGMLLAVFLIGMLVAGNVRWSVHGAIALTGVLAFAFGYSFAHLNPLSSSSLGDQLLLLGGPLVTAGILCCLLGESACYALVKTQHRNIALGYGGVMLAAGFLLVLIR
ncbi:HupE/UreJ family protein [Shewanella sp. A3A]|uniref:HupE/UreJ family protein n=1 Tax=Shewanella electrica TaxID=515560 RepID=A0ABT2FHI0_9GAMM|nr:HupE/UreJ family protein [Shewanella electrica]MCH1921273.1 HupE/UreJ family protein [Shewanella ferrihydritica]MCH1923888.1 HupE/UreJ family protein [Shewanella electrica]MCS4555792.1 HupE/UreJ family protein [Shewanella electrica]